MSLYSAKLLQHFQDTRYAGELERPDVKVQVENPACGDILELTLKIEEGRIAQVRYRAKGCVPAMGCASAMAELVEGKTPADAAGIGKEDIVRAVESLPPASGHAAQLAIDALHEALDKLAGHTSALDSE
jgi:nitrogen fixation NifU-like protein